MSMWLGILMGQTALAVILATVVLMLHHRPAYIPVGPTTSSLVKALRAPLFLAPLVEIEVEAPGSLIDGRCETADTLDDPLHEDRKVVTNVWNTYQDKKNLVFKYDDIDDKVEAPKVQLPKPVSDDGLSMGSGVGHKATEVLVEWTDVAVTLDRLLFLVFTCVNLIVSLICLLYMALGSS